MRLMGPERYYFSEDGGEEGTRGGRDGKSERGRPRWREGWCRAGDLKPDKLVKAHSALCADRVVMHYHR